MNIKDLKNKNITELQVMLKEKRESVLALRFKNNSNQLKSVREIRQAKKDIARILTLINTHKYGEKTAS